VYLQARRSQPLPLLSASDAPVMEVNCERRASSTVATQSLMLLNGDFLLAEARRLAARVRAEASSEQPPIADVAEPSRLWQFGVLVADDTGSTPHFRVLPHWTGSAWQGGPSLPNPALGWALLHATGGHPGERHAVVRRWTAPRDGVLSIVGRLKHLSEHGDGVRGRLTTSRSGTLTEWAVRSGEVATDFERIAVERGDTVDFVTGCGATVTSDSFEWVVRLDLRDPGGATLRSWESAAGFRGPGGPPLLPQVVRAWRIAYARPPSAEELRLAVAFLADQLAVIAGEADPELAAMTNLCQALLGSNEFLYAD
jgi:Protein of unknown function (DUF1553)